MKRVKLTCDVFYGTIKAINHSHVGGVGCTVVLDDDSEMRLSPTDLTRLRGLINVGTAVIVYTDKEGTKLYLNVYPKAIRGMMFNVDAPEVTINLTQDKGNSVLSFFQDWVFKIRGN